jgi:hypothetical protein
MLGVRIGRIVVGMSGRLHSGSLLWIQLECIEPRRYQKRTEKERIEED